MLTVNAFGLQFKNPIVAASTDMSRSLTSYDALLRSGVGGVIIKSVTDSPQLRTNDLARFMVTDSAQHPVKGNIPDSYTLLSRGGAMVSIDELAEIAPELIRRGKNAGAVVIGSISASEPDNWLSYAQRMEKFGFHALELNFGNPHGEAASGKLGYLIGQASDLCAHICNMVSSAVNIPVIAKLTPQVADLTSLVLSLEGSGISGVTIMHRYQGLILSDEDDLPMLGGRAAIGGPWMKPITLANLSKAAQATKLPIIGGNGIDTARDVYEYILCGASLVEVGSALMLRGPSYTANLVRGLKDILRDKGVAFVTDAVGSALNHLTPYTGLDRLPKVRPSIDKEKCTDCTDRICLDRCYFNALSAADDGTILFETSNCSGCGLCAQICPHQAVTMAPIS